jgi:NADPH:quinone reductase-like Zn-dependent oxidoreductase
MENKQEHSQTTKYNTDMKKVTQNQYGDTSVLKIIDCDKPRITGKGEVLVKVHYSSLNAIDWKNRKGLFRIFTGWFSPRSQPGFDIVGSIVDRSDDVNNLEIGDKILSLLGTLKGGAFSQYVIIKAEYAIKIAPSPDETIFAGLPMAASTAWMALVNHGKIKRGDKVLINGGSSGVGHYAIQIAKHYGAEVTAVTSEKNEAFCRELGADNMVNYQNDKFTEKTEQYNIRCGIQFFIPRDKANTGSQWHLYRHEHVFEPYKRPIDTQTGKIRIGVSWTKGIARNCADGRNGKTQNPYC